MLSKQRKHIAELSEIFSHFPNNDISKNLFKYLMSNSSLPGPRGNLELAAAFEEIISNRAAVKPPEEIWQLCSTMAGLSAEEAPVNDPREFIAFCGARGLGAIGAALPEYQEKALLDLRTLARDSRWRMREGVAMALQKLLSGGDIKVRRELEEWIKSDSWLVLRGVVAGIAEPSLLKDSGFAEWALEAHKRVIERTTSVVDRKSEEFRTLRKALGYSLSVVVRAIPSAGFLFLKELAQSNDTDIKWIVKENLKKNRLTANYPKEVALLAKMVE
jgi:hypothetical protein